SSILLPYTKPSPRRPIANRLSAGGSGVADIDVRDGVIVNVAVPVALAATLRVPVRLSDPTPLKVGFMTPPPLVAVTLKPFAAVRLRLTAPAAPPVIPTLRSVRLKPAGAASVKLSVLDVLARAVKSRLAVKPPAPDPEVIGVSVTSPCRVLDRLVATSATTLPLMLHPVVPRLTKLLSVPVTQLLGLARLTVAIAKNTATIISNLRILFSLPFGF